MAHVVRRSTASGPRYDVRYRDPAGTERSKAFRRKVDADAFAAKVTVQVREGDWLDPELSRVAVQDYARTWLAGRVDLGPATLHSYRRVIEGWIVPRWGGLALAAVTHEAAAAWLTGIADPARGGRSVSWARTVRQVFGQVMEAAVRARRIRSNPVRGIRLQLPPATTRRGYLTHEQVRALAEAAAPRTVEVYLLAYCGLRWSELSGLRVGDVDLLHGRLHVVNAAKVVNGRLICGDPKGRQARIIPYPQLCAAGVEAATRGRAPDVPLFPGDRGGWLLGKVFQTQILDPACTAAGLARLTPHHLRHTCASLAVQAGGSVKDVQALLGHESAAITLDTYADLFPSDLSDLMGRLDAGAAKASRRAKPDRPALGAV